MGAAAGGFSAAIGVAGAEDAVAAGRLFTAGAGGGSRRVGGEVVRGASLTGVVAARGGVDGADGSASACGFAEPPLTTASVSETAGVAVVLGAVEVGCAGEAATGTA
jgi:hypothetical protein